MYHECMEYAPQEYRYYVHASEAVYVVSGIHRRR